MRTQLIEPGSQNLDNRKKCFTFATAKGVKTKVNSIINNNKNKNKNNKINININIMEIIYNTIQTTLNSFDFAYCIIINIITYFIINIINNFNGNKDISKWSKRIILICCIIIVGFIYYIIGSDIKLILNSSILAPVFWSWIIKPICIHFKLDYKQINLFE